MLRDNHAPIIYRLVFALLFSWLFISSPWGQMVQEQNPDVKEYLARIEHLLTGSDLDVDSMSLFQYLLHEPIWRYILILIGENFHKPIEGLMLISFSTILVYAFFLCGRVNLFLISFFLFNPVVVDLVMAQVRSAFAMAIFLIALTIKTRALKLIVIGMASMIHTVVSIFFIIYLVAKYLESKKDNYNYRILGIQAFICGVVFAIIMGGGKGFLFSITGDRRFAPSYEDTQISLVYLSYWILLALVLAQPSIQRLGESFKEYWTSYFVIIMFTLPFVMGIFNTNGIRFVPLSFPIFLYSMTSYTAQVRSSIFVSLFAYQIIQYLYWLKII
jgi:hypothetical protein